MDDATDECGAYLPHGFKLRSQRLADWGRGVAPPKTVCRESISAVARLAGRAWGATFGMTCNPVILANSIITG